jgi:hypothetical protein|nr:MAG TPA: hypothetical protein [Caudoviricetes sp.]
MLIISENELRHTDSCQDFIEHHGVKGMKWGQRVQRWGSAAGRAAVNTLRHPILSDRAISASRNQSKLGTIMGTTRSLEFRNRYVKDMVKAQKQYKKDRKNAQKKFDRGDDKIFNKYSQDAFFSKRRKAEGESRKEYGERQRSARQKMDAEYKGLKNQYKKDVMYAKTKRGQKRVLAGGRY